MAGAHPPAMAALVRSELRATIRHWMPWAMIPAALSITSVAVYPSLFPTDADKRALAVAMETNPAITFMLGNATDIMSVDGFNTWRSLALGCLFAGIGAILCVVGATRSREDSGQAELVLAGAVPRAAGLVAAWAVGLVTMAIGFAVCVAGTILSGGIAGPAFLLAADFLAAGIFFAALAGLVAQFAGSARGATTWSLALLVVMYTARGLADAYASFEWMHWVNPLSWIALTQPAIDDKWWLLIPVFVVAAVLGGAAYMVQQSRDYGAGLASERAGSPGGTKLRVSGWATLLLRPPAITWLLTTVVLAAIYGGLSTSVDDLVADNPTVGAFLASGAMSADAITGEFLHTVSVVMGVIIAVPGVQFVNRLRAEETSGRLEWLASAPVSRVRLYLEFLARAIITVAVFLAVAGVVLMWVSGERDAVGQLISAIPAAGVLVGIAALGVGIGRTGISWAAVVFAFIVSFLGPGLNFPDWLLRLSPMDHLPVVMDPHPDYTGLYWLSGIAVVLCIAGLVTYRRRDLRG